jgi:hypothetical protein
MSATPPSTLLARAVRRVPVEGHDGRSGATLERVELEDGSRLIVKTARPDSDITSAVTGGRLDRELTLWSDGCLDDLPAGVGHCVLEAYAADGAVVTVMRDLGDAVVGWDKPVSRADCRRILAAAASLHDAFLDSAPPASCRLEDRLVLLGPLSMHRLLDHASSLPKAVVRGWDVFADLAPPEVADGVLALFDDPARLAEALRRTGPTTLVHGDLWLVNLALEREQVALLDWNLATAGPAVVDFASFLAGTASRVRASREQIVEDFRDVEGDQVSDENLRLGLLSGLLELGWNKALDSVDNPDPVVQARERADLDWWLAASAPALELL